jgi:hypothetical protein
MPADDFQAIYAELRARMLRAASGMHAVKDGPQGLVMHAPWPHPTKPKEPMWFGGVEIRKAYVSYHLMPVYGRPSMVQGLSPALKKRMQGKACFNFKTLDPGLMDELERLTAEGARLWAKPMTLADVQKASCD